MFAVCPLKKTILTPLNFETFQLLNHVIDLLIQPLRISAEEHSAGEVAIDQELEAMQNVILFHRHVRIAPSKLIEENLEDSPRNQVGSDDRTRERKESEYKEKHFFSLLVVWRKQWMQNIDHANDRTHTCKEYNHADGSV
jgi:hypothetical protein